MTLIFSALGTGAVLVLATGNRNNVPMVIGFNGEFSLIIGFTKSGIFQIRRKRCVLGEYDDNINFTFEPDTGVYGSCAAILNDEMFVLGGDHRRRQVNFH